MPYYHHARQERIKNLNQIWVIINLPLKMGVNYGGGFEKGHLCFSITMNVVCLFYATDKAI